MNSIIDEPDGKLCLESSSSDFQVNTKCIKKYNKMRVNGEKINEDCHRASKSRRKPDAGGPFISWLLCNSYSITVHHYRSSPPTSHSPIIPIKVP